jgi:Bacterial Ig-like domain (group 3)/FG-GAP-like repeat/FG-GAP repeat
MKRACFACLFLCLTTTFLLSQSNPVPLINQNTSVVSPISASQLPSFHAAAHRRVRAQTEGLNFAPAVTYDSGGIDAFAVAVADVNGDGKPDIVETNYCGINCTQGAAVLLGNGDGTFQPALTYNSGPYGQSIVVADVNGDGKPDLVVANECDNSGSCSGGGLIAVLLGNGDGTFQTARNYYSGGVYTFSIAAADVNGDGKPDLVVANRGDSTGNLNGTVSVLLGNGDGTFQTAVNYVSGGALANSVAVADVNGDGYLDVVVANICQTYGGGGGCSGNGPIGVLIGNGDGTFQTAVTYDSGPISPQSVAIADVNGDGKPDIVVAGDSVAVLLGNGDGTFQTAVNYGSGASGPQSLVIADVNGDGQPDLVVANSSLTSVLLGNGDGTFQTAVNYGSGGDEPDSVAVADVNGDGLPDFVVANRTGTAGQGNGTVGVLINTGTTPVAATLVSSPNPSNPGQAVTFTATVTPQQTGMVSLFDGTTNIGNFPLNGNGVATLSTSSLGEGTHNITAFAPSTSPVLYQSVKPGSATTIASSSNPSIFGQSVTFTATVTPQGSGTPTGTVTFKDGATTLGIAGVSGNAASLTTSGLAMGTHSITAIYSGDSNFTGSTSNTVSQVVTKATTTTTLLSSINPSVQGKPVTFTAVVSSLAGTPTGKVQFLNGKTVLATKLLTSGSAKYTTSTLAAGSNIVTAVYLGDSKNNGSTSAPVNQFVLAATTTTLKSSPNPSKYGQAVTFTAKVTSSIGAPPNGETVTFKGRGR